MTIVSEPLGTAGTLEEGNPIEVTSGPQNELGLGWRHLEDKVKLRALGQGMLRSEVT